jgi:hypothetical protein
VRPNKLAAPLDGDTEGHQRRFSHGRVLRSHVSLQLSRQDGEDLLGRESLGELVERSEGQLRRVVVVIIIVVLLATDGQQSLDDDTGESQRLDLALFAGSDARRCGLSALYQQRLKLVTTYY